MAYPPDLYRVHSLAAATQLMRAHPFAHVITAQGGLALTRLPVVADCADDGRVLRLRAHFDAKNPQVQGLDGASVLVAFSGPAAYVSPLWRADKTKGGTYDYEEVQVRGRARVVNELAFFTRLVDDLSALIEPQHREISAQPIWQSSMAPPGHLGRQLPWVTPFLIEVDSVVMTAKLHQQFPEADRRSIVEHLSRSHRDEVRAIAARIRMTLSAGDPPAGGEDR